MFPENAWYVLCEAADLKRGELLSRRVIGIDLVAFLSDEGVVAVVEDRCCHRGAPLSMGRLETGGLRCQYHGLKFDLSGKCIDVPGQSNIPSFLKVRAFSAVTSDRWVWVWMGELAKADPTAIPQVLPRPIEEWDVRSSWIDYEAGYELLNDNLTDFSHVSYVHHASFGATESFANAAPTITDIDNGLRFDRWLFAAFEEGSPLAETLGQTLSSSATWQTYDYLAPGILVLAADRYPPETVPLDHGPPVGMPLTRLRQAQAVTPIDETHTRYFYQNAIPLEPGSTEVSAELMNVFGMAFEEDRKMIEAQQRNLNASPQRPFRYIAADEGPTRMRKIIERLKAS